MRRKTEILLFRWLHPKHFVLLMAICSFLAFLSGYIISVSLGKVSPLFPYISDTGTTHPASNIFALLLVLAAVFGKVTVYYRHRYFESRTPDAPCLHRMNDIAMFFGILSCLGMIGVACFPWTEIKIPHYIGAYMTFFFGVAYCWFQTFLTYASLQIISSKSTFAVRLLLAFNSTMLLVSTSLFSTLAARKFKGSVREKLHWSSKNPGYHEHLVAAFSEWLMSISFILYFITYYREFKNVQAKVRIINCNVAQDINL